MSAATSDAPIYHSTPNAAAVTAALRSAPSWPCRTAEADALGAAARIARAAADPEGPS